MSNPDQQLDLLSVKEAKASYSIEEPLKLPAGHEFSPGQVDLTEVLSLIEKNKGDSGEIKESIREKYFSQSALKYSDKDRREEQQTKRAGNVLIAMGCYGLYDSDTADLTLFGKKLLKIKVENERFDELSRHILKNLNGRDLILAIRNLQERKIKVTKESLHVELERMGFKLPRATTHHLTMINWLRKSSVVVDGYSYRINDESFEELAGISNAVLSEWKSLTFEQQVFLKTLYDVSNAYPEDHLFPSRDIINQCEFRHGKIFKGDSLSKDIFKPLEENDWVDFGARTKGRGAKSGNVKPTEKLRKIDQDIIDDLRVDEIPGEIKDLLNQPTIKIYQDLSSQDTYIKGLALETLTIKLVIDLTLQPFRFRERSSKTGGAEVDLIADGIHLHYSRWLFQCKNIKTAVSLSALAKEVGMATLLKAHVIVLVTTSRFAQSVLEYAKELSRNTPFQTILIDGEILKEYVENGSAALLKYFHQNAKEILKEKRAQIIESSE
jgi:hypothetical protein